ncbi:MAG: ABC transporter ATP-binding protein [Anaerolineales bacterium]
MSAPLLSFRNVHFGYRRSRPILRQASFDLSAGRITAVVGPNGVGKTTLLYLALGWLQAWSGEILLDGRPLSGYGRLERGRRMALVPQSENTPFDYTLFEYVLLGRAPHLPPLSVPSPADQEMAWQVLEKVGLTALAGQPVPQLSSGERQLMLLARAILQTPRLLLLDEPTAHLDLHNKARLLDLLRQLRAEGVTLLMTNHEPDVVLALADDVILMESGQPPQAGPLGQLFTAQNLSRIYRLPVRLVEVEGGKHVLWT